MAEAPRNRLEGDRGFNPFLGPIIEVLYEDGMTALVAFQMPDEIPLSGYVEDRAVFGGFQKLSAIPMTTNPDDIHLENERNPFDPMAWRPVTLEALRAQYRRKHGEEYVARPERDPPVRADLDTDEGGSSSA